MDHYIEITLKPDAEMRENVLLNKVYIKLHKALFDLNAKNIGVSFPDFKVMLGEKIRLHGNVVSLEKLQAMNWLGGLSGYCVVSKTQPIPANLKYRNISRIQSNMTQAKLNRLIKRGTIDPEKVRDYKAKLFTKGLDNPYVELESSSNGHKHRRYIELGVLLDEPVVGEFDHFGLSKTATIPWF